MSESAESSLVRRCFRDPLSHFLLLGGLLIAIYYLAVPEPSAEFGTVRVGADTVTALIQRQEELLGRSLTAEERERVVQEHIDDEVLLREARRLGYDRSDVQVRERLIELMRFILTEEVPPPTRQQLEALYEENLESLRTPPATTFEQVLFSWDSPRLPEDPTAFLTTVRAADEPKALGETLPGGNVVRRAARQDLLEQYGFEFADSVMRLEVDGEWQGPFVSPIGLHYVQVVEKHESAPPRFWEVERYLETEWTFQRNRATQQARIGDMRKRYRIEVEAGDESRGGEDAE